MYLEREKEEVVWKVDVKRMETVAANGTEFLGFGGYLERKELRGGENERDGWSHAVVGIEVGF